MEVVPSEYQGLNLSKFEKLFTRYAISNEKYGFCLLKINPTMEENQTMNVLIVPKGVLFLSFYDGITSVSDFFKMLPLFSTIVYERFKMILSNRMLSNKAISENKETLKFSINLINVFPNISRCEVEKNVTDNNREFIVKRCLFSEDFSALRKKFTDIAEHYLDYPLVPVFGGSFMISDNNVNSILQRIAPEYVTCRVASLENEAITAGIDKELLVIDDKDVVVKAFRLDKEQINIVNKISKDEPNQLILACAGSGKSVLLISKCFKAAQLNPTKKFLITCKNENLRSFYTWMIDRAGLRAKNVECMTFHKLCKTLLERNHILTRPVDFDGWISTAIEKLNSGKIRDRYYGVFIDEVQAFEPEWYKFCYNLLENKNGKDHIFVICGDKTQRLEKLKKRGMASWQVGEGYPSYRGGNRNIRIEKNYRNCIEINEYINRFVSSAKQYLYEIERDYDIDPDMFLRGQSFFHGEGVELIQLDVNNVNNEVSAITKSIIHIHDHLCIPYDEIAVIMYNGRYRKRIHGWQDKHYDLQNALEKKLQDEDIPYCTLFSRESSWQDHFGDVGGVKLVKFQSSLGLDFRAAIICGLITLGEYHKIKKPEWELLKTDTAKYQEAVDETQKCIQNLYVACTRAKEILYIVAPDDESVFIRLLEDSI